MELENALMPVTKTAQTILETFCQAALRALIRAEKRERVPARFTGVGPEIWKTFRNELTLSDLLILAIHDAAANMPIPFDPARWLNDDDGAQRAPTWSEFNIQPDFVESWLSEAQQTASLSLDAYLQAQAKLLNVPIPSSILLEKLPTPQKYEHWLELPGTGGWVAYALCSRPGQELYLWENFTILCNTSQEMILAGLIAWELGAPPNLELPIYLDDANLTGIIRKGQTFNAVIGYHTAHAHRDLRFLHQENKHPLWI